MGNHLTFSSRQEWFIGFVNSGGSETLGAQLKLALQDILIPVLEVLMIVPLRKCFIQLLDKFGPSLCHSD